MSWTIEKKPIDDIDGVPVTRISIGGTGKDNYIVYRGNPQDVATMLKEAQAQFKKALPTLEIVDD